MKLLFIIAFTGLQAFHLNAQINFVEASPPFPFFDGFSFGAIAFADIDKDLDQDVIISGSSKSNGLFTRLYKNDGNANFTLASDSVFIKIWNSIVTFADVDNDNDQDVLISGYDGEDVNAKLYKNDGSGNFTPVSGTIFQAVQYGSVTFADVDNDNDKDVLIAGRGKWSNEQYSKLYLNDGIGNFTELTGTPFMAVEKSSVVFADVDNDNDQDVLISGCGQNTSNVATKLYKNDGSAHFTEVVGTPFPGVYSGTNAFADVDNDNDLDVIISGKANFEITQLFVNNGTGNFTLVTGTPFKGVFVGSLAFSDVDNDNDPDVLIVEGGSTTPRLTQLYENNGMGNFKVVAGTTFPDLANSCIAFADVNNDTYQDVLVAGHNYTISSELTKLYLNSFIATGINKTELNSEIDLYPNPGSGLLTINNQLPLKEIKIESVTGKLLKTITTNLNVINLTDLPPGIYFIKLITVEKTVTKKFIKQ